MSPPRKATSKKTSRRTNQEILPSGNLRENEGQDFEVEPGFIEKASEHGRSFLEAYQALVTIYPDKKKNFEVNVCRMLETYMNAVLSAAPTDDPKTMAVLDFARAGILVHGSTSIYCKKVVFLEELLIKLTGYVDSGVSAFNDETGDNGDVNTSSTKKKGRSKNDSYMNINLEESNVPMRMNQDRRSDKKWKLRPMCFPVLLRQDQCDIDKKRITTLNPSFTGDKTTFRLWGPLSGHGGCLVSDLASAKPTSYVPDDNGFDADDNFTHDDVLPNVSDVAQSADVTLDNHETTTVTKEQALAAAMPQKTANPLLADAESGALTREENKENDHSDNPWNLMDASLSVSDLVMNHVVHEVVPRSPLLLDIQESFLKNLNEKGGKAKKIFGDEGASVGLELQAQNKLLVDTHLRKRKRYAISPEHQTKPAKDIIDDTLLFKENDSDSEDVIGFDEDGGLVYVPPPQQQENIGEAMASIDQDDWANDAIEDDYLSAALAAQSLDRPSTSGNTNGLPSETDDQVAERITNWFQKIEKLQKAESKKPQFTFNAYCSKVLQGFPPNQDLIKFSSLAEGLPAGQTARYLLATLQLANTNNVEIRNTISGEISNETMEILLLNKNRVLPSFDDE